jgi:hypothetical protein
LRKYRLLILFKALLYAGVSSLFLPLIWYVSAWREGGDDFLNMVLAENFGRFFHIGNSAINYELGHENGVWYNALTLVAGFIPWTILLFFSLFGIKWSRPRGSFTSMLQRLWQRIRSMEKLKLFSLVALVCILFFYSIPSSKRSVYLMPAYPFIALFMVEYILHIVTYRTKVTRIFAGFLAGVTSVVLIVAGLILTGLIDPAAIAGRFTHSASTLSMVETVTRTFASPDCPTVLILLVMLLALATTFFQMRKKINLKMLYASIFLVFTINLLIDGVVMRGIHNATSARPFAEHITKEYPLDKTNTYVMNNLKEYANLYGLNFYMKNSFHNFEKEQPVTGYFLIGKKDAEKAISRYGNQYTFTCLMESSQEVADIRQKILLFRFTANQFDQ